MEFDSTPSLSQSCGSTSRSIPRFVRLMHLDHRDRLNQLGSELAGILEEASAEAALLAGVSDSGCDKVLTKLEEEIVLAGEHVGLMRALLPRGSLHLS
ncbi:hypothetical protein [Sphingomonas swuensis]|uniref:hypothetical protein n=1 Tax=Sphingomonas swuensis TaxID=977800 RepID=UPI0031E0FFD6